MRYTYAYRTSEGTRREDAIEAESRDDAFAALRARGIRPIKVVAADGSKANGEVVVKGVRKRIVALVVIVASVVAAVLSGTFSYRAAETKVDVETSPRHWLPVATADFKSAGDAFLARFARPGVAIDEPVDFSPELAAELREALAEGIAVSEADGEDEIELKRIVAGLKQEMKTHLRGGNDYEGVVRFFIQRQRMEVALRNQILESVGNAGSAEKAMRRAEANEMLSTLGFEPIGE